MAVRSLDELRAEQASEPARVKPLGILQAEQKAEIADGARDPVFGHIPVEIRDESGSRRGQLRDALMRKFYPGQDAGEVFGPGEPLSEQYWGKVLSVDRKAAPVSGTGPARREAALQGDAETALEAFYTVDLGFSPAMAYQHRDQITEALFGGPMAPEGAMAKIADNYKNGQIQVQLADLGLDVIMGRDTPATWQEIERLRKAIRPGFPGELDTWWGDMIAAAAEQMPLMGETVSAAPVGAAAGGVGALAAGVAMGVASPTIGEEALLPSMVWAGIKGGAGLAGAYRVGQLEAGGSILDLLDAGVDPAVAKAACVGIGAINGALELGQIRTLLATLPGGKGILKKATGAVAKRLVKEGTLRGLVTQHAARFGGYLGAETLQELAQESVSVAAEELGKYITEELGGDVDYATLQEIKERMIEVGTKSAQAFTVIGIPGSSLSLGVDAVQMGRYDPVQALLPDGRQTQVQVRVPEPPKAESTPSAQRAQSPDEIGPEGQTSVRGEGSATVTPAPAQPETVKDSLTVQRGRLPGGRQAGGTILFDPDEWGQLIRKGRELVGQGATDFAAWSEQMVAVAGESVRPALQAIYESATMGEMADEKGVGREAEKPPTPERPGGTLPEGYGVFDRGESYRDSYGRTKPVRPDQRYGILTDKGIDARIYGASPEQAIVAWNEISKRPLPDTRPEYVKKVETGEATPEDVQAVAGDYLREKFGSPSRSAKSEAEYFELSDGRRIRLARHSVAYAESDVDLFISVGWLPDADVVIPADTSSTAAIKAVIDKALSSFNPSPRSESAGAQAPAASERDSGKLPGGRQAGSTILFNPDEWRRLVTLGRDLFEQGGNAFAAWSQAMVAAAGEEVRPALEQIWQLAVTPTVEPKRERVWEREPPKPIRKFADMRVDEIARSLRDLSFEALRDKAKEIGLTVRGKKNQLAALIAEAIKAKAGPEVRRMATRTVKAKSGPQKGQKIKKQVQVVTTRIADKKALADTEKQIREHPVYKTYAEGSGYIEKGGMVESRAGRVDPERTYFVEPEYRGEVEGYVGKRGAKGFNARLASRITFDKAKGQGWDQAVQEQGLELDFSGFMASLAESVASQEKGPGGINEAALKQAIDSGDPSILILAEKRKMLRAGASAYDINKALEKLGADLQVEREDYEDLLIGGGILLDPDDPHPGSLSKFEFQARLGRELADRNSEWIRRWSLPGVVETPFAWHQRLKAEWQAIQVQGVAADLSLGEILSEETTLTADQETELNAIDAEKVAAEIVEREKQTMFSRLLDGLFDDAAVLRDLRDALRDAYRAGAAEAVASAREAYRAQRQKVKARSELRKYVTQLMRHIKRPVGKSVAIEQRLAIEEIQAEIDPAFRSARTTAQRQASRKFFAEHPEAQAPAKVLALVKKKSAGEMTVAEIEETYKAVRELQQKGKILRTRQNEVRARSREEDLAAVENSLTGGQGLHLEGDRVFVRPPDETARQTWWNRYAATLTPERFLDWLDRGKEFLGPIFKIFWERVADAEAVKAARIKERTEATVAVLTRLKLTYADLQETAVTAHNGEDLTVEMCIGAYNFMKNLSSQQAIQWGNNLNPADQTKIQEYVEGRPQIKELADWIVEHYEEHYERLRQSVIDVEDRDMGREDNYTPMRRMEQDYTPDERQVLDELMQRAHFKRGYAEKGMTLMRKDIDPEFQKPVRLDAWSLLLEQIERQEHYIAMAGIARDLQAMMRDEGLLNALRERGGRQTVDTLKHYVDAVGNPNIYKTYGETERFARQLRRNTSIAFLAYKLSTMLKQPVSLVRALPYAGMHLVQAGLDAATDWRRVRDLCVSLDPLLEKPALERELEELKISDRKGWEAIRDQVGQTGMKGLTWMDGIGRTIGWYGVYLHEMSIHGDQARAVKQARLVTSMTQAGARAFQLPELFRTNQEWKLLLMQFTNEVNKVWNVATYDWPKMLKNSHYERAAGTLFALGLEAGVMWMISNGRLPEDEDDALEAVGDTAINMVPIWGPAIVGAWKGYSGGNIAAVEGVGNAAAELGRLGRDIGKGTVSDGDILDAAHKVYKGLAPLAGVPYTGPRDIIRTVANQDLRYLLGGGSKRKARAGTGRQRGSGRGRRRARRR